MMGGYFNMTTQELDEILKKARTEALEEAAKIVESGDYDGDTFDLLAAAIRALK